MERLQNYDLPPDPSPSCPNLTPFEILGGILFAAGIVALLATICAGFA